MYTEEFTHYTFIQDDQVCDNACVTWSMTYSARPLSPRGIFHGLSARVHDSLANGQWLACVCQHPLSMANEQGICYIWSQLRIHAMKIHTVNYM